ncbi:MAG: histidine phosphatase family protein [Candidatus Vogelbacteria bacterium]|nr:histidine phosphatase family protein [Candidatus Vogelbacteria bacterium]
MAKNVWLIRHAKQESLGSVRQVGGWQPEAELAPESTDRIKAASEYFIERGIHFSFMAHSGLIRSRQTAQRLRDLIGGGVVPIHLFEGLGPGEIGEWEERFSKFIERQPDPENPPLLRADEIESLFPDLCAREGERVLGATKEIALRLEEGGSAGAVSHFPLIQLAESLVTGNPVRPNLGYCQAICFTFESEEVVGCEAHLY